MKTERHDRREQRTDTHAGVDPKEGGAVMLRTKGFATATGFSAYTRLGRPLAFALALALGALAAAPAATAAPLPPLGGFREPRPALIALPALAIVRYGTPADWVFAEGATSSPYQVSSGGPVAYTIQVTNVPDPPMFTRSAKNVEVVISTPKEFAFQFAYGTNGFTCTNYFGGLPENVLCWGGEIAAGDIATITVAMTAFPAQPGCFDGYVLVDPANRVLERDESVDWLTHYAVLENAYGFCIN